MKQIFCSFLAVLFVIGIFFSVPETANAANVTEKNVVQSEIISPELHNASSASVLNKYFDVGKFKSAIISGQEVAWKTNDPYVSITISGYSIPTTVAKDIKNYVDNESGVFGVKYLGYNSVNSYITSISLKYLLKDEYDKALKEQKLLDIETEKILSGIKGNNSLTDVEKALLIHDRLALTCSYGKPSDANYSAHTAYSAIVLKKAVCQGYALAYQYLLGLVGIKSEYVSSSDLNHGWNIVYINNIPYHVDVTWDDASGYTEEGKVYHDNFLRSTQGMIETGHCARDGSIDYNSTPVNTTYDNYFWQNSSTGFQLLNNEIYYFDNLNKKLMKINKTDGSDATLIKNISYNWGGFSDAESGISSYTRIASDGKDLYYSTPFNVYKINPETKEETLKFTLDLSGEYDKTAKVEYYLWGLSFNDCIFTYDAMVFKYANWEIETESKQFYEGEHKKSGWITDKNANCKNKGEKHIECTVCKTVLSTGVIPVNGVHVPGSWVVKQKATVSKEGIKVKVCTVCNKTLESKTLPKLPVEPKVAVKISAKGMVVSWNKTTGAKSYIVYKRVYNASTKKYSGWQVLKTTTGNSFTDTTVKPGITYSYAVRAANGESKSSFTATKGLMYNISPTVKVANVSNGVKVSWSTVANATGYTVYSSSYNTKTKKWSSWKNRGTTKAGATSWVDKAAKSGVKYKYTVRACNGKSFKSSYKASLDLLYLAQPTVTVKAVVNGINVNWTQSAGATGYTVYRMEYNAKTKKWTGWKNIGTAKKTAKSWNDKSAKMGVVYKYTVRAVNGKTASTYKASGNVKR